MLGEIEERRGKAPTSAAPKALAPKKPAPRSVKQPKTKPPKEKQGFTPVQGESNGDRAREFARTRGNGKKKGLPGPDHPPN